MEVIFMKNFKKNMIDAMAMYGEYTNLINR